MVKPGFLLKCATAKERPKVKTVVTGARVVTRLKPYGKVRLEHLLLERRQRSPGLKESLSEIRRLAHDMEMSGGVTDSVCSRKFATIIINSVKRNSQRSLAEGIKQVP